MVGRFFLGVGTGENLNEHVTGARWPAPDERLGYRSAGGDGPCYGQARLCFAADAEEARRTVFRLWRQSGLGGTINQELPRPSGFEAVAESVTIELATEHVPCGPDPEPVVEAVRTWEEAGFDHLALHQVGPGQEGFFRFWERELRPSLGASR